jgi:hypothetical protein
MAWLNKKYLYFIILVTLVLVLVFPGFSRLHNLGRGDWDLFCFWDEVPRVTINDYHQFPLWNPYASGGRPMLANPQAGFLRPTFFLSLLLGCAAGLKIEMILMLIIGMLGMFLLMRRHKMSPQASILAASLFGLSSYFTLHIAEGHVHFTTFALFPYIFLFFLKSFEQPRWLAGAAALIAWIVLAGGAIHELVPIALFLGMYGVLLSIKMRSVRPALYVAAIFALAFLLTAIKSIPVLQLLQTHQRPMDSGFEKTTLKGLYEVLLGREQRFLGLSFEGQSWHWHEYGAYVGFIPLIAFIFSIPFLWRKQWPLIITGLLALFSSMGNIVPWAPWNLLRELPLIHSTHVPSRYIIMFIFAFAFLVGQGYDRLDAAQKKHPVRRLVLAAIAVFVIVDLILIGHKAFSDKMFDVVPPEVTHNPVFHQMVDQDPRKYGDYSNMYLNLLANNGTLNANDNLPFAGHAREPSDRAYRGEVYVEGNGIAAYSLWSPNRLAVAVTAASLSRVVVNQNYYTGWKTTDGRAAEDFNGLLSANITSADHLVEFYYLPDSFLLGSAVSAVTLAGVMVWLLMPLRSRRARPLRRKRSRRKRR